jgi:hypothetical protein
MGFLKKKNYLADRGGRRFGTFSECDYARIDTEISRRYSGQKLISSFSPRKMFWLSKQGFRIAAFYFQLLPQPGVLKIRTHNVSDTEPASFFR